MLRDNQNEQQSRLNKNSFFAIPPDNIDDLKQFIRRQASDNGNLSPQTQGRHWKSLLSYYHFTPSGMEVHVL